MKKTLLSGKTLRWTFTDGPMATKTFEHAFALDGSVTFRSIDGATKGKPTRVDSCEVARVSADVCAMSYLSSSYTLTVVLNFDTGKLFAFSSNEKELGLQHGTFEDVTDDETSGVREGKGKHAGANARS